MLYIKDGYPEVNEIVYTTVTKIYGNSTFVKLDEYDKEAVLTISEIAPGRIRNLRDHVSEDRKIVCKVLRVDPAQKRIDVSLRRVSLTIRNKKLEEIKKEEFSEKTYDDVAKELKITKDELFEKTYEPIFEEYETVFEALYAIMLENTKVDMFTDLSKEQKEVFVKLINERIKPEEVTLKKQFILKSNDSNGVDLVKDAIKESEEPLKHDKLSITYKAAGEFQITITHDDMKSADMLYNQLKSNLEKQSKEKKLQLEFN